MEVDLMQLASARGARLGLRQAVCLLVLVSLAAPWGARTGAGLASTQTRRTARSRAQGAAAAAKRRQERLLRTLRKVREPVTLAGERPEPDRNMLESPQERSDWFLFQRSYPFNALPTEARQKAFRQIQQFEQRQLKFFGLRERVEFWRSIGPSPVFSSQPANWGYTSGRVHAVAVSPADPKLVLVGSATGGIWRSTDGGEKFAPVADDQADLAVSSIAFSRSKPSVVYASMGEPFADGYMGSGVLKSVNGGAKWSRLASTVLPESGQASKILVDPRDHNRVFLAQYTEFHSGTIYSGGFYFSENGGRDWKRTLSGMATDLILAPGNPKTLYMTLTVVYGPNGPEPPGLYKSEDGGETWKPLFTPLYVNNRFKDIRVAASGKQTLYVYSGSVDANNRVELRLDVSDDGGKRWKAPFMTHYSQADKAIKVSHDSGQTWVPAQSDGLDMDQFGYNTYIVAHPTKEKTLYVGARDLYKSTDGGATWTNETRAFVYQPNRGDHFYQPELSTTHPDQHALAFDPNDPSVIYVGNDGGLWKSTNGGASLRSLNATLSITQFNSLAAHPSDPNILYGGTQDNGTQRRLSSSASGPLSTAQPWQEFSGGDGGKCLINPADPGIVFISYIYGAITRYSDNGQTKQSDVGDQFLDPNNQVIVFNDRQTGERDRIGVYPPLTGNGVEPTIYFGTHRLWVSNDLGENWDTPGGATDLTKGPNTQGFPDVLSAVAVAPSDSKFIYTGSAHGRAMFSSNGGAKWEEAGTGQPPGPGGSSSGLPDRFISDIEVDRVNPKVAYLTTSGFLAGHVFKTNNGGLTWDDISDGLPDIPADCVLIDPNNADTLYVGTDVGVFRKSSGSTSWAPLRNDMPPAIVTDLVSDKSGRIYAATHGRGVYELTVIDALSARDASGSTPRLNSRGRRTRR
jgi:photosystem II stability/assembly factor-like uncharacterized protein